MIASTAQEITQISTIYVNTLKLLMRQSIFKYGPMAKNNDRKLCDTGGFEAWLIEAELLQKCMQT